MKETTNLKLKKPDFNDFYSVDDFNFNSDVIDKELYELKNKANEALQAGVNAKENMVQAINSKKTVPYVTNEDSWETLTQRVNDIKEGRGNAVVGDVLSGKTFTNDSGQMLTGTMPNRGGAVTVTPGTTNQVKSAGYYSGDITIKGDTNLKGSNILKGITLFGITGTLEKGLVGASAKFSIASKDEDIFVSGLNFKPKRIIITQTFPHGSSSRWGNYIYIYDVNLCSDMMVGVEFDTSSKGGTYYGYDASTETKIIITNDGFRCRPYVMSGTTTINYWYAFG